MMLPVLLGVFEKHSKLLTPEAELVTTTTQLCEDANTWRTTVRDVVRAAEPTSFFLQLGFPLPDTYTASDEDIVVRFRSGT